MIPTYNESLASAQKEYNSLNAQYNRMGLLRLLVMGGIIALVYYLIQEPSLIIAVASLLAIVLFLLLVIRHKKISTLRAIAKAKIRINEQEIDFLTHHTFFAGNGKAFEEDNHPYAYDLDILGERSLYQYINRTHTFLGRSS